MNKKRKKAVKKLTNYNKNMQNEPNLQNTQINVTLFNKKVYENKLIFERRQNEPNTNPIRSQFKPKQRTINHELFTHFNNEQRTMNNERLPKRTQNEPNLHENEPNSNPVPPARLFTKEASLPRLVSAIEMEISEDWVAGKRYLNMNTEMENKNESADSKEIKNLQKNCCLILFQAPFLKEFSSNGGLKKSKSTDSHRIWPMCKIMCKIGCVLGKQEFAAGWFELLLVKAGNL